MCGFFDCFVECSGDHRDLHVLTPPLPSRRSSDLLFIGAPVFWLNENLTLLICFLSAATVWLTPAQLWNGRTLDWLDGVGLAAYAVYGAAKALANGVAPVPSFGLGVLTACLGGIIRDILAGQPSIIMRPELYVTAAALAPGLMVAPNRSGLPPRLASCTAAIVGFALRAGAIRFHLSLPVYDHQ